MRERAETFVGVKGSGLDTDGLLRLIDDSADINATVAALEGDFTDEPFHRRLGRLMEARGVNAARLSEQAMMSRSFVYQLCAGEREPGRDVVLRLALLLKAGVPETQRLLRSAGRGTLYPRVRRDAVLLYALKEGLDIAGTEERLAELGEEPLVKL